MAARYDDSSYCNITFKDTLEKAKDEPKPVTPLKAALSTVDEDEDVPKKSTAPVADEEDSKEAPKRVIVPDTRLTELDHALADYHKIFVEDYNPANVHLKPARKHCIRLIRKGAFLSPEGDFELLFFHFRKEETLIADLEHSLLLSVRFSLNPVYTAMKAARAFWLASENSFNHLVKQVKDAWNTQLENEKSKFTAEESDQMDEVEDVYYTAEKKLLESLSKTIQNALLHRSKRMAVLAHDMINSVHWNPQRFLSMIDHQYHILSPQADLATAAVQNSQVASAPSSSLSGAPPEVEENPRYERMSAITIAMKMDDRAFFALPNVQRFFDHKWNGDLNGKQIKGFLEESLKNKPTDPIEAIKQPFQVARGLTNLESPFLLFILEVCVFLGFSGYFFNSMSEQLSVPIEEKLNNIFLREIAILIFAISLFIKEIEEIFAQRKLYGAASQYFSDFYNILDVTIIGNFAVYFITRFSTYGIVTPTNIHALSFVERIVCFNAALLFLRCVRFFEVSRSLGIFVRIFLRMSSDMGGFLLIFCLNLFSFSFAFFSLYHNQIRAFSDLPTAALTLFRSTFSDHDEALLVSEDLNVVILFVSYIVIACIVLLNLLIAIFTSSYTAVASQAEVEWCYYRARLVMSLLNDSFVLAPYCPLPFNVLSVLFSILINRSHKSTSNRKRSLLWFVFRPLQFLVELVAVRIFLIGVFILPLMIISGVLNAILAVVSAFNKVFERIKFDNEHLVTVARVGFIAVFVPFAPVIFILYFVSYCLAIMGAVLMDLKDIINNEAHEEAQSEDNTPTFSYKFHHDDALSILVGIAGIKIDHRMTMKRTRTSVLNSFGSRGSVDGMTDWRIKTAKFFNNVLEELKKEDVNRTGLVERKTMKKAIADVFVGKRDDTTKFPKFLDKKDITVLGNHYLAGISANQIAYEEFVFHLLYRRLDDRKDFELFVPIHVLRSLVEDLMYHDLEDKLIEGTHKTVQNNVQRFVGILEVAAQSKIDEEEEDTSRARGRASRRAGSLSNMADKAKMALLISEKKQEECQNCRTKIGKLEKVLKASDPKDLPRP